jgi:serine/threonine protein kinase
MNPIVIGIIVSLMLLMLISIVAGLLIWASYQPGGISGILERLKGQPVADAPYLLVTLSDGHVSHVRLHPRRPITIGRDASNTIVINNHLVSRCHARVFFEQGRWMIEDNNSSNGTFQNGRLIAHRAEIRGDAAHMIEIGAATIQLVLPAAADHSQIAPATGPRHTGSTANATPGASSGDTDNLSRQMFGRFVIVRTLGEGGMSRVLLGQDISNQQKLVAIKILHHPDEFLAEKFRQEGGLRLEHPHIVRVLDADEYQGRLYIVMEYVEGVPLRKLLQDRPQPLDVSLSVIGQVLQALEHAHKKHIVHRDIKPSNLMISPQYGTKIIDFGIAKMLMAQTRTQDGMRLGTPQYMSYEQASAQPVTTASDIYSVSIVLYEMLTGKIPFSSDNPMDVVRQHLECKPTPPRQINSNIPAHIEQAILRALEKDASLRPASASAFAQELGCTPNQPLPAAFAQMAARQVVPVQNERSNAPDLPTRMPPAVSQYTATGRYLRVHSGPRQGQVIQINNGQTLGRESINLSDGTISRQHFSIEYHNGTCMLQDRSAHGTVVNNRRLNHGEQCHLQNGAIIHVGQTTLVYEEQST